jgi:hypothetical protein
VRQVIESINDRLAVNADYAEAYAQLWTQFPEYKTDANVNILDERISVYQTVDVDALIKLVENPNVRKHLTLTSQAAQVLRDEQERLQLIEEILQGQDQYSWRGNTDGRLYSGTRAELEQDDLARLQYINDYVQAQRALYAADTKTVREEQRKREIREAQVRSGLTKEVTHVPVPDFYENPNRPGVRQSWSENLLRRLPNSEIERVFNLYGEQALTIACRKALSQQLQ